MLSTLVTAEEFNALKKDVVNFITTYRMTNFISKEIKDLLATQISNIEDATFGENVYIESVDNFIDLVLKIIDIPYDTILKDSKDYIIKLEEDIKQLLKDYNSSIETINKDKKMTKDQKEEQLNLLTKDYKENDIILQQELNMLKNIVEIFSDKVYLSSQKNIATEQDKINSRKLLSLSIIKYIVENNLLSDTTCKGACFGSTQKKT